MQCHTYHWLDLNSSRMIQKTIYFTFRNVVLLSLLLTRCPKRTLYPANVTI